MKLEIKKEKGECGVQRKNKLIYISNKATNKTILLIAININNETKY